MFWLLFELFGVFLFLATSIWVLVDALIIGIKAPPASAGKKKGVLDSGPVGFFIGCLLLWVVVFPLYLVKRRRHLAKVSPVPLSGDGLEITCPHCGMRLSLSLDLFGRAVACPGCQGQFTPPAPRRSCWYYGHGPALVGWAVYPVFLLCCGLSLSRANFHDFLRTGNSFTSTPKLPAIEEKVRKEIQEQLAGDLARTNTQIKRLTLVQENEGLYKGTLVTQTGNRSEENEVLVTVEDGEIRWRVLSRYDPEAKPLEWNRQEPDAHKNENAAVALQNILRDPNYRTNAIAPAPARVVKTPSDYYGKPLRLSGRISLINRLSADNEPYKAHGLKPGFGLLLACDDKTVVEMQCMMPNLTYKSGDLVTVYGFAIGTVTVTNPAGGVVTRLAMFGSDCELGMSK